MSGSHSRFAPSSAARVCVCPGSLIPNEREPDEASYEAVEGTVAHWVHEEWIKTRKRPTHLVGKRPWSFMAASDLTPAEWEIIKYSYFHPSGEIMVTEAMLAYLEESVIRCLEAPGEHYPEERVDISRWCPEKDEHGNPLPPQGGTADHFACSPGLLYVDDLKYGIGEMVFAANNYQAILYALGVIERYDWMYDFDKIVIRIMQPRLDHFDVWETTKEELLKIGEYIKHQFTIALQPNAPFSATEKGCRFCKLKPKCAALALEVLDCMDFEADDYTHTADSVKVELAFLSVERMTEIFRKRGLYKLWMNAIEADMTKRLLGGEGIDGLKLVHGRSNRRWSPTVEVVDEFALYGVPADKLYKPRELISPAEAEKLVPRKDRGFIAELVTRPLGKATIVDASDKRSDYQAENTALANQHFDAADEFDD